MKIYLLIMIQTKFHLVYNQRENCQYEQILCRVKRNKNLLLCGFIAIIDKRSVKIGTMMSVGTFSFVYSSVSPTYISFKPL